MTEYSSGNFVLEFLDGLWERETENAILYLYRKALILASELMRPHAAVLAQRLELVRVVLHPEHGGAGRPQNEIPAPSRFVGHPSPGRGPEGRAPGWVPPSQV